MLVDLPDVDIDIKNRDHAASLFPEAIVSSLLVEKRLARHKTGLHLQKIPVDPVTNLAAFPHDVAEELGYYKLDFLSAPYPYEGVQSMEHLDRLLAAPVDWSWFHDVEFVGGLFHFKGVVDAGLSMAEVVNYYKPETILDLAHMVAIKMPAKKGLIGEPWEVLREEMWKKDPEKRPQFKKSHSISYSLVVTIDAKLKRGQLAT